MEDGLPLLEELVQVLSPTAGQERARELVRSAIELLGVTSNPLSLPDAIRVLELLGRTPGVVGSVTRFARARLTLRAATASFTSAPPPSTRQPFPAPKDALLRRAELTALLAPSLGDEKSGEVIATTIRKLGYREEDLTLAQALAVLETLTYAGGLVGVAARFAKARLHMRAKG